MERFAFRKAVPGIGGAGADSLWGGAGNDTFQYTVALTSTGAITDVDAIYDFGTGTDVLNFTDLTLNTLRGAGTGYFEGSGIDGGLTLDGDVGFFLATNTGASFSEADIYTALSGIGDDLVTNDIIYVAISNGTDSAIVRITEVSNADLSASDDKLEYVVKLVGVNATELAALSASNFSNFTAVS